MVHAKHSGGDLSIFEFGYYKNKDKGDGQKDKIKKRNISLKIQGPQPTKISAMDLLKNYELGNYALDNNEVKVFNQQG